MYKREIYYFPCDTKTLNILKFITLRFTHTTIKIGTYNAPRSLASENEIEVEIETLQKNFAQIENLLADLIKSTRTKGE